MRSRIGPRCASIGNERIWLFRAACSYFVPERIWSDQSRRKSTANTASAIAAMIITRAAMRGVKRYGSSTRGSGGRKRALAVLPTLANDRDPLDPVAARRLLAQDEPDEGVGPPDEERVQRDRLEERAPEHLPHRGGV